MNVSGGVGRGQKRRPVAEINVVPYIDVTLVLLIIFMVTAPMLQTGVDVDLPQAETKTIDPSDQFPIIVSIDSAGKLFVDINNQGDIELTDDDLSERVIAALEKAPDNKVLIRGDQKVNYGRVVSVMAALKKAGVPSVGLMTSPKEE